MPTSYPRRSIGFTLIELAIVLIVIALLGSPMLSSLLAQRAAAERQQAAQQLSSAVDALLGFALVNGRLPCPANPTLDSSTSGAGQEDCTRQHGVLPWAVLGLAESDPWGMRLSYYADSAFSSASADGSPAFTLASDGSADVRDGQGKTVAGKLPAVIVCHGLRAAGAWTTEGKQLPGASGDELENADADTLFVQRPAATDFDDQVTWLAPAILKARLVSAGRLP